MNSIKQFYPIFEEDQVLTAEQLNSLRSYLGRQDRVTRSHLIGIGIVCGLELTYEDNHIVISEGVGVTSRGYLIGLPESECVAIRKYEDKKMIENVGEEDERDRYYQPFIAPGSSDQIPLWELLTEEEEKDIVDEETYPVDLENGTTVEEGEIAYSDYSVLLYLEINDRDMDECCGEDCDEEGIRREFTVRKLLIKKEDLSRIASQNEPEGILRDPVNACAGLDDICMERLGYRPDQDLSLDEYKNFHQLLDTYVPIIKYAAGQVEKVLADSYKTFRPVLAKRHEDFPFPWSESGEENGLQQLLGQHIRKWPLAIQYAYDFLKDLIDAYDEFRDEACEIMAKCSPNTARFKRHLMLGPATPTGERERPAHRHYFQPSPILDDYRDQKRKALLLFDRLVEMVKAFDINSVKDGQIKITPDRTERAPLSKRSIPYYYNVEERMNLIKTWNYEKTKLFKWNQIPSYHAEHYNTGQHSHKCTVEPLSHVHTRYEHFRVEGHVGKEYEDALDTIENLREQYNLPFKVVGVKLSERFENTEMSFECRFEDLQNLYRSHRTELMCMLEEEQKFFNGLDTRREFSGKGWFFPIYTFQTPEERMANYIEELADKLTDQLKDLDVEELQNAFDAFMQMAEDYKDSFDQRKSQIEELNKKEQIIRYRLDKLISSCSIKKIKKLHELYRERVEEVKKMNRFSDFASRHSGMEHLAGVPRGGTLVLVYIDQNEESISFEGTGFIESYPDYGRAIETGTAKKAPIRESKKEQYTEEDKKRALSLMHKMASEEGVDIDERQVKKFEEQVTRYYSRNFPSVGFSEQAPDHLVVADFALPYLCKSDCPELSTMVISQIHFSLSQSKFCRDDNSKYPFYTHPAGGEVSSPAGGVSKEGDTWYFKPSESDPDGEDIQFTYQVHNQTVVFNVRIFNPQPDFDYEIDEERAEVSFINLSEGADTFEWQFGDGSSSAKSDPVHSYEEYEKEEAIVTLIAKKQGCVSRISKSIGIPQEVETEFDIRTPKGREEKVYCGNDGRAYPFTTEPPGDEVTGEFDAGIKEQNGTYYFEPQGYNPGTYTFHYRDETLEVEVLPGPDPSFDWEVLEKGVEQTILQFFYTGETEAETLRWTRRSDMKSFYGDGAEVTFNRLPSGETHTLSFAIVPKNGCQEIITQDIDVPFEQGEIDITQPVTDMLNTSISIMDEYYNPQLEDALFEGEDTLIAKTESYLSGFRDSVQSEEELQKYMTGEKNLEIARNFESLLMESYETITSRLDSVGRKELDYLIGIYVQQVEQLLELAAGQNKDIRRNSKMGNLLQSAQSQVGKLMDKDIDVNPENRLYEAVNKAKAEARRTGMNQFGRMLVELERTIKNG